MVTIYFGLNVPSYKLKLAIMLTSLLACLLSQNQNRLTVSRLNRLR